MKYYVYQLIHPKTNEPFYIGKGDFGEYFNGAISTIRVYNRALYSQEIRQNFEATKGRFGL